MTLQATDDQVMEMGKLAVLASRPVGMGFLQHRENLTKEQIELGPIDGGLYIDYYCCRMVKFSARKSADGWSFPDFISHSYQSWIDTYPSYRALFEAVTRELQSAGGTEAS